MSAEYAQTILTNKPSVLKRILAFFGPAYLIAVGYLDPGNWATDIAGGSQFGYSLLWVLVMSNIIALLLQNLCCRLGIITGKDLAQTNRLYYPMWMNYILYVFAEIAIIATDLAEVVGMAVGLNLLFGLDITWGVWISFLNTFLILALQKFGIRKIEIFIISLISTVTLCFCIELFFAKPDIVEVSKGLIPAIPNETALYIAIGMIGATVMPHNLYLHSSLVQSRKIGSDTKSKKQALKYNFWDTFIALSIALFVNAAILILAAATFHKAGFTSVSGIEQAHQMLEGLLGSKLAPIIFAIALIAAGQSSTITGTMAGQIVMEGYINFRIPIALRRVLSRLLAIIPTLILIHIYGNSYVNEMLIFSQVLLSMQLGFAVIPLIYGVSNKERMGGFTIGIKTKIASWVVCAVIIGLNIKLVIDEVQSFFDTSPSAISKTLIVGSLLVIFLFLLLVILYPLTKKKLKTI